MKTVYAGGEGEIVEKKSRFIANVRPVSSEEEAVAFINEMKKKYWDARHNCSAFVIGDRQEISRRYPGIPGNYGGFYQNIYEHLRLGKPLQTGAHDILNVIRVIEAAYRSQQERKIIELK